MRKFIFPLVLAIVTSAFWGLSKQFPDLLEAASIKAAAGIYCIVMALMGFFWRQYMSVSGTDILKPREAGHYFSVRRGIRHRIWGIVCISAVASLMMLFLAGLSKSAGLATWIAIGVGFGISMGIYLLLVIARWMSDLADFSDSLRLKEQTRKYSEAMLKRLADASKSSVPSSK